MLEEALYGHVASDPGVAAIADERVYPVRLPEGAVLPAIAYQRVSTFRTYTHDPDQTPPWMRARIQFACWADTPLEAIELARALIVCLSGHSGAMGDIEVGTTDVEVEIDDYEADTRLYRRIVDVMVSLEEPVAS